VRVKPELLSPSNSALEHQDLTLEALDRLLPKLADLSAASLTACLEDVAALLVRGDKPLPGSFPAQRVADAVEAATAKAKTLASLAELASATTGLTVPLPSTALAARMKQLLAQDDKTQRLRRPDLGALSVLVHTLGPRQAAVIEDRQLLMMVAGSVQDHLQRCTLGASGASRREPRSAGAAAGESPRKGGRGSTPSHAGSHAEPSQPARLAAAPVADLLKWLAVGKAAGMLGQAWFVNVLAGVAAAAPACTDPGGPLK
jgi:hypothetical protein